MIGICSDAGGGNSSLVKGLLGGTAGLDFKAGWSENCFRFRNPAVAFDDDHAFISVYFCATHGLMAIRNLLLHSQESGTREFCRDGVKFGWIQVVETYRQTLIESKDGNAQVLRRLTECVCFPDSYTLMTAHDAKVPFEFDTIAYQCTHLATSLRCLAKFKAAKSEFHNGVNGYESEILHCYLKIMKACVTESTVLNLRERLAQVEYAVMVHSIYLSQFLNSKAVLIRDFVADPITALLVPSEETRMPTKVRLRVSTVWAKMVRIFESLDKWREEACAAKDSNGTCAKSFFAVQTYTNLKITLFGFLRYAESALKRGGTDLAHVPFLHANSSTVENIFSQQRSRTRDTPAAFVPKGMLS